MSKDPIETSNYYKFLREAQQSCIKACSYSLKSMPVLHDPILKCLSVFLKPSERLNVEEDHLTTLISRFPLAIPTENIGKLELELLDYQTANNTELPRTENDDNKKRKRIDQNLLKVSLMKDAATETPHFPNLSNLARFLLFIPHSNPSVKVFSAPLRRFLPTQDTTWARMSLEGMLILVYMKMKLVSETILLAC